MNSPKEQTVCVLQAVSRWVVSSRYVSFVQAKQNLVFKLTKLFGSKSTDWNSPAPHAGWFRQISDRWLEDGWYEPAEHSKHFGPIKSNAVPAGHPMVVSWILVNEYFPLLAIASVLDHNVVFAVPAVPAVPTEWGSMEMVAP